MVDGRLGIPRCQIGAPAERDVAPVGLERNRTCRVVFATDEAQHNAACATRIAVGPQSDVAMGRDVRVFVDLDVRASFEQQALTQIDVGTDVDIAGSDQRKITGGGRGADGGVDGQGAGGLDDDVVARQAGFDGVRADRDGRAIDVAAGADGDVRWIEQPVTGPTRPCTRIDPGTVDSQSVARGFDLAAVAAMQAASGGNHALHGGQRSAVAHFTP